MTSAKSSRGPACRLFAPRRAFVTACLLLTASVLGRSASANLPYRPIELPADDGPHLADPSVVTEWWFYNGKLTARKGGRTKHLGYYATVQYYKDQSVDPTLYVEISDIDDQKVYAQTVQLVHSTIAKDALRIDSKELRLHAGKGDYRLAVDVKAQDGTTIGLDLILTPRKAPLLIGPDPAQRGLVTMGNGTNSFYYSITRLRTEGAVRIGKERYFVDPDMRLSRSWLDRQWGDFSVPQVLSSNPWIWFAINTTDGTDMNVGEFISPVTGLPNLGSALANISLPDGSAVYKNAVMTPGPEFEGGFPTSYTLEIEGSSVELRSIVPNQDQNGVWMGIVSLDGQDVRLPDASFATVETTIPTGQLLHSRLASRGPLDRWSRPTHGRPAHAGAAWRTALGSARAWGAGLVGLVLAPWKP